MALAYCNDCRTTHFPDQHRSPGRRRSGGRHLAPSPARSPQRLITSLAGLRLPEAEVVGARTRDLLRSGTGALLGWARALTASAAAAIDRAPGRIRSGWEKAVQFSGVVEPPGKHDGKRSGRPPLPTMPITRRSPGIVEFDPNRPPLLEVSMLESLGFYDGDGSVVVAVSSAPHMAGVLSIPASRTQATASPAGPQPGGSRRLPMLPDPDLGDWKPHVIARSKLGPGSVRVTTVAALAVAFLILLALGATVLHRPLGASDELRRAVASQATQLAGALDSLAISLNPSGLDEVGATTSLVNVDQAARALFEAGGRLDPDDPLRAATTALAHRALDLENRLTEALSYRLLLGPLWRFPDLESSTDPTEAAAALSPWQARINAVAGALPRTPDLTGHAEEVAGFVAGFPDWAAPFLDALAERDSQAAGARLADLERTLGRLAVTAEETVGTVIADASHQRAEMSADLHQLVAQATTP